MSVLTAAAPPWAHVDSDDERDGAERLIEHTLKGGMGDGAARSRVAPAARPPTDAVGTSLPRSVGVSRERGLPFVSFRGPVRDHRREGICTGRRVASRAAQGGRFMLQHLRSVVTE